MGREHRTASTTRQDVIHYCTDPFIGTFSTEQTNKQNNRDRATQRNIQAVTHIHAHNIHDIYMRVDIDTSKQSVRWTDGRTDGAVVFLSFSSSGHHKQSDRLTIIAR